MRQYKVGEQQKEELLQQIKAELEVLPEIEFAYVHGSFISNGPFKDVDIAIFNKNELKNALNYELNFAPFRRQYLQEVLNIEV